MCSARTAECRRHNVAIFLQYVLRVLMARRWHSDITAVHYPRQSFLPICNIESILYCEDSLKLLSSLLFYQCNNDIS